MLVMAPDPSPAPQVQLNPLPYQYSADNVSSPASKSAAKVTLQFILKKVSKIKLLVPATVLSTSYEQPERRAMLHP